MKILVIDDNEKMRELVSRVLRAENFLVDSAFDFNSGFQKGKSKKYDAIVLDVMLGSDPNAGFKILSGWRTIGVKTPVLILSARALVDDRIHGLNLGADDYLIKNFIPAELVARVRALSRRRFDGAKNVLKCGDLTLDITASAVSRAGRAIRLTKKEFGILATLLRQQNAVVSRETLLDSVWGDDTEICSNAVDVHVRSLRKKIESGSRRKLIRTVRGFGYMISDKQKCNF